jgi:ABC-2 type transport system ATP-binding protein
VARTAENATAAAREMRPSMGTDVSAEAAANAVHAVRVESLHYAYGDHVALHGVSFDVGAGEIFGLLGPNGGGKTTLFRILSTLVPPQSGTAHVLGRDVARERDRVRAEIGVVFQAPALDRKLTVRENLRHQGHLYGLRGGELDRRIHAALERFHIADRRDTIVEQLSGGLRRRVEIAKALLHRPRVLILDEPSTGLDPGARLDLWAVLQEIRAADGVTVLLTSHILEETERCDRLAILDGGRLVAAGRPSELKARVGGDVITIATTRPQDLGPAIASRFGVEPLVVDGVLRIERQATAALVGALVEAFPGEIESVALSRPTLEDVFIQCTGHRFRDTEPAADPTPRPGARA